MSKKLLKAIAGTTDRPLKIGDIEIPCYVLEDETRVLSQRGMIFGLGMRYGTRKTGADRLAGFVAGRAISRFISNDIRVLIENPIKFQSPGGIAYGYPATLLTDLCNVVIDARNEGALQKQQLHIADRCQILIRGFAQIGIIGLVDEATGYQEIRARNALAKILEKFLAEELQPWTKTFPLDFYSQIFRLRAWPWHHLGTDIKPKKPRTPGIVAHYTNDLVYERIAPGVLEELRRRNPTLPKGYRKHRHFQWFTPDFGHPKLKEHLAAVIALMRASSGWDQFMRNMNRAFPKLNETIELPFDD